MPGRLDHIVIVEKKVHLLLPGEAKYDKTTEAWFIGCPSNSGVPGDIGTLAGHDVTYDEQAKTLTVSPSILCGCGAHYFIRNNKVEWV